MAQPATNPKIEELRFRLKTDPKSRLFYQLAEELRKGGDSAEAERVLRSGLESHPTYLAAWVSLGRVSREQKNDHAAVEALNRALQLDPGNVVAARLLADSYDSLGEKVEAVKKYKLVHALMPGDDEVAAAISRLEQELGPPPAAEPSVEASPTAAPPEPESQAAAEAEAPFAVEAEAALPEAPPLAEPPNRDQEVAAPSGATDLSPFEDAAPPFEEAARALEEEVHVEEMTGDAEPMHREHEESPFEDPVGGFTSASVQLENAEGFHLAAAPANAELPAEPLDELPSATAPAAPEPFATGRDTGEPEPADAANTLTMADLYARQGLVEQARAIYERILARDPDDTAVREKLESLTSRVNPKIAALERWLEKVSRREVGRV